MTAVARHLPSLTNGLDFGKANYSTRNPLEQLLSQPIKFVDAKYPDPSASGFNYEPINVSQSPKHSLVAPPPLLPAAPPSLPAELVNVVSDWPPVINKIGSGLFNSGNTCYLNATLQSLIYLPALVNALLIEKIHTRSHCQAAEKNQYCSICSLYQLMAATLVQRNQAKLPSAFIGNLKRIAPHFRQGRQEDSHEFMRFLIDHMQSVCLLGIRVEALKANPSLRDKTPIFRLFGGKLQSRVKCSACHAVSDTLESFLDLSLPLNDRIRHISDALEAFCRVDQLRGANRYKCEACKKMVDATKEISIHQAPNILTIHIKRFGPTGRKLNQVVNYNETLRLADFMSTETEVNYRLDAIISHVGSGPNSGHYFAHVRGPDRKWYKMDDSSVSLIHQGVSAILAMKGAYMLLYSRIGAPGPDSDDSSTDSADQAANVSKQLVNGNAAKRRAEDLVIDSKRIKVGPTMQTPLASSSPARLPQINLTQNRPKPLTPTPIVPSGMFYGASRPSTGFHQPQRGQAADWTSSSSAEKQRPSARHAQFHGRK